MEANKISGLPKQLFYVKVKHGDGSKLRVYEKGGGKYTSLVHAQNQQENLARKGIESKIYQSQILEWTEVEG